MDKTLLNDWAARKLHWVLDLALRRAQDERLRQHNELALWRRQP